MPTVIERDDNNDMLLQAEQDQRLRTLGMLAAAIAHDFNNVLTAIIGHATLLGDALPPDHPERASVEEILAGSNQAAALTRQLLAFARGNADVHRPVDVNDVARETHALLSRVIGVDVHLSLDLEPDLARVSANTVQLQQVLVNLIMNARDALPANRGHIWIRTRNQHGLLAAYVANSSAPLTPPTIDSDSASGAGDAPAADNNNAGAEADAHARRYAVIEVEDEGIGMPASVRSRLFEPFFSARPRRQGTGLGMAIVADIVRRHRGRITVESELGAGARIRVLLPALR